MNVRRDRSSSAVPVSSGDKITSHIMLLPDFRVRQRDYLLEISRALTQELDLEKLLARILRIAIEMLAGQAGLIALKEDGWRVAAAQGIAAQFLSYLTPLLA